MKKSRLHTLLFILLAVTACAQEVNMKKNKEHNWSAIYFSYYQPDFLLNHSIGVGFGTKDVRFFTGFSYGRNIYGAKYNNSTDSRNYFYWGDFYGAFLRPEADIFHIGRRFTLSATCLINYSYGQSGYAFQMQDSLGAPAGNEYVQKSHTLDFFYGLNGEIKVYKNFSLGAGVLMKFFSCNVWQTRITDFRTNTSNTYNSGYNGQLDSFRYWFYPSAYLRYAIPYQR
jgi:hypothetical protein